MADPKLRKKYRYNENGDKADLKFFEAEFYDRRRHPKRKRISLRTKDESAAMMRFADMVRKYHADLFDPWTDPYHDEGITAQEAIADYITDQADGWSESSLETYETVLRIFLESLPPGFPLRGIKRDDITDFLDARDLASATRRSYQDRLRIFFRWCIDAQLLKENPVPDKGRGKASRMSTLPKYFSGEQYDKLLECIRSDAEEKAIQGGNEWLLNAIEFALGTGLRRGEICSLRWRAVSLEDSMVDVRTTEDFSSKSGRERRVPLVGRAKEVIQALAEDEQPGNAPVFRGATGGPVGEGYLSARFRFYRKKAGLPTELHFHSLRHTFASWFVMRGGDLYRLKEIMGHADMKTTMKYAHLRPDALIEEMEKCFG
jgi:integrase